MKPLNLKNALKLHEMLAPHFPIEFSKEYEDPIKLVNVIVSSMIEKGMHDSFVFSIALMHDIPEEEFVHLSIEEIVGMFIKGLVVNDIVFLMRFCQRFN